MVTTQQLRLLTVTLMLTVGFLAVTYLSSAGFDASRSKMVRRALQTQDDNGDAKAGGVNPPSTFQYRGVNLGGWLVLESWMYPDWWTTTGVKRWEGEWQFCQNLTQRVGKEKTLEILNKHWDTWLTRKELEDLKSAGIKHLRIPIGYWILGEEWLEPGDQYLPGAFPYLLRALKWCKELGLQAVIDLHGAPGVQNAHDNGGFSGPSEAIKWPEPYYQNRTIDVLVYLAKNMTAINQTEEYKGSILGLCLLNEPWTPPVNGPVPMEVVKDFSQKATDAVIEAGWKGHIWYPDGFNTSWDGWKDFLRPPKYQNVFADTHNYMLFDPNLFDKDSDGQITHKCSFDRPAFQSIDISSGIVVGEWSMDFTLYPKPEDIKGEVLEGLQKVALSEMEAFGIIGDPKKTYARGGFFWSFKSYGRVNDPLTPINDNYHSPWSYLAMWQDKIVPANINAVEDLNTFSCAKYIKNK